MATPDTAAVTDIWERLLDALAVEPGACIMLGIDMARLPLPRFSMTLTPAGVREHRDRLCDFVYGRLEARLGGRGTLIVPAFTYSCGRPGTRFEAETTPSELGIFPEYVRQRPGAIRSLHPIFSLAAIGPGAAKVLDSESGAAFGPLSPFGNFRRFAVRFVSLGIPVSRMLTYVHHLEQCAGCSHRYNKVVHAEVYARGRRVDRTWLAYLRYRGVDLGVDLTAFEAELRRVGVIAHVVHEAGTSQAVDVADVEEVGYRMLARDPFAFATSRTLVELDDEHLTDRLRGGTVVRFRLEEVTG